MGIFARAAQSRRRISRAEEESALRSLARSDCRYLTRITARHDDVRDVNREVNPTHAGLDGLCDTRSLVFLSRAITCQARREGTSRVIIREIRFIQEIVSLARVRESSVLDAFRTLLARIPLTLHVIINYGERSFPARQGGRGGRGEAR